MSVFSAPSAELYVALVSKLRLSAGNWSAYEKQTDFEMVVDASLSGLVLSPEIEPAVLVISKTAAMTCQHGVYKADDGPDSCSDQVAGSDAASDRAWF